MKPLSKTVRSLVIQNKQNPAKSVSKMGASMSDWTKVRDAAINAAKESLGHLWNVAAGTAVAQISGLVAVAKHIDDNKDTLSVENYQHLMSLQKTALVDALAGIKMIGITAAQNAAAAAMDVLIKALPGLLLSVI